VSVPFDPRAPAVLVEADVVGPVRTVRVTLALDTGASVTSVRPRFLVAAGYDPAASTRRGRMRSATGGGVAPLVEVAALVCLGRVRTDLPVLAHDPPPVVIADGLLGLDFFRGRVLTLDFARGRVTLRPPRGWWQFWR
jgi:hypothetical protein